MAGSAAVDALPYVDQEYDVPALREAVRASKPVIISSCLQIKLITQHTMLLF